jgi:hypothetical protein
VNKDLHGAPEPWGLGGSPTNVDLMWSGEDTLCGGRRNPLSLVEKLLSGDDIKVTKGAWRVPLWQVKWYS